MNFLKAGLRVKLNLTNPYEIKPEYKLFTRDTPDNRIKVQLDSKFKINNDSYVVRFRFTGDDSQKKCLGHNIGQFVRLHIGGDKRSYVPISPIDEAGGVQFLIRDLSKLHENSFTKKILNLSMNEEIELSGPGTQFIYKGYGKLIHGNFKPPCSPFFETSSQDIVQKTYKNIGIITHASGITTTFSLIESVLMNYDNVTGLSLLWLGDSQDDFTFLNQLGSFAVQGKLNMNLMLTKFEKGWLGPYGPVSTHHLQDFMPFPQEDTMIIMSALQGHNSKIKDLIKEMKYPNYFYA